MTHLFAPLSLAVVASVILASVITRLRPKAGAWLMGAAIASVFAAAFVTSWTVALAFLAHEPLTSELFVWCRDSFGAHEDPTRWAGVPATIVAVWSTLRAGRVLGSWRRQRGNGSTHIQVVASRRPLAFAEPGRHGGIVVSTAMLAALKPDERRALLAHEQAHLEHRHDRFLIVGDLAVGLFPLRFAVSALRHCLERWADEDAARTVGDRRVVARAVARAALIGHDRPGVALSVLGGDVPARVEALVRPPLALPSASAWAAVAATILVTSMVAASIQLHHLAGIFAAFCPG